MARGIQQLIRAFGASMPALARAVDVVRSRCDAVFSGGSSRTINRGEPRDAFDSLLNTDTSPESSESGLACRIRVSESAGPEAFIVEISGSMPHMYRPTAVSARITFVDMTLGVEQPRPVLSRSPQHRDTASNAFSLIAGLGVVQQDTAVLSQWMKVAEIPVEWLKFPAKGRALLACRVCLLCTESGLQLTAARCTLEYVNSELGYIDAETSLRRANTLAVSLALAVTSAHNELSATQVERLRTWARNNILKSSETEGDAKRLDKALDRAAVFFANHHQVDFERMCRDVAEIVPAGNRCDIFELCLDAVRARGFADQQDLTLLQSIADWLEINHGKSSTMLDEFLPATMRDVEEPEAALGITSDMNPDEVRKRLNAQYRKWHSRVTSSDPKVRHQADAMLKLIADVRSGHDTVSAAKTDEQDAPLLCEPAYKESQPG